jgi:hypothetical protein
MMRTVLERLPVIQRLGRRRWALTCEGRQRHRPPGVWVVLLADLDHVDGPRESRLVGVRRVTTVDEHATCGIHPALDVVVHTLAPGDQLFQRHVQPFPLGRISEALASIASHPHATSRPGPPGASDPAPLDAHES